MIIDVSLDYETRSACNLLIEGAYRYATDPTTQILCCSYLVRKSPDDPGKLYSWFPEWVADAINYEPDPPPWQTVKDLGGTKARYTAWNSAFDRLIWQYVATNDYGWPDTAIEDWVCSSALARTNGLPGKLIDAALALRIDQQKDRRGQELIKLLSLPNGGTRDAPTFNEDPELLLEMVEYCDQDVRTEHGLLQCLRPFSEQELKEFHASEHINDRGIGIDVSFAREAMTWGDAERELLEKRLGEVTNNAIERPTQYKRIKDWMLEGYILRDGDDGKGPRAFLMRPLNEVRLHPDAVSQMFVYKGGERKISMDKAVRHNILALHEEQPEILSDEALEVIELTDLANKSSTAKYKRMVERELDGRVCGAYMFAGAASTGRFSAVGVQPHNMVRDTVDDFDEARAGLANKSDTEVIHTLAKMMRLTVKDDTLHWSDWSNVEGRMCPWLADTPAGEAKLDMFRRQDAYPDEPDVYEQMAALMSLDDRQTGKVCELSLQFGGGEGAFAAMARNYGVRLERSVIKSTIGKWRDVNPWAVPFWYALKDAAWSAMTTPMERFYVGRVCYFYTPDSHNGLGTLWCELPSGRLLAYVYPKFEHVKTPWNENETMVELTALKANFKPKAGEYEWPRYKLWYGVLCENITQAACADILRAKLVRFEEAAGVDVVMHTHDEIISKSPNDVCDIVTEIMHEELPWAPGLPLAADIARGPRYKQNTLGR